MTRWGIPADAWQIIDGSGLSRRNAIAPEALVAVLQRMYDPSGGSPWMTALPVAGRDGTLAGRMRARRPKATCARRPARCRTSARWPATCARATARTLAFAIMADNFEGPGGAAADAIDRIAVRLANLQPHVATRPACHAVRRYRRQHSIRSASLAARERSPARAHRGRRPAPGRACRRRARRTVA